MIAAYYKLAKPGIVYGNTIVAAGAFLLASRGEIDLLLMLFTLGGLMLVMASSCVCNNIIDVDIDAKMERTERRPLVSGVISRSAAFAYAAILGGVGVLALTLFTNILALGAAILGFFFYVVVYSLWVKRTSMYSTVIGSVAGAMPPLVGYLAVSGAFDMGAVLLFLVLVFWQMPHFYALAMYRRRDYQSAGVVTVPEKRGSWETKVQIPFYILLFGASGTLLTIYGYTGWVFLSVFSAMSAGWLLLGLIGFAAQDEHTWAYRMFITSIIVLFLFSVLVAIDVWLW